MHTVCLLCSVAASAHALCVNCLGSARQWTFTWDQMLLYLLMWAPRNKHSAATKESRLVVKARKKDLASASNRCSARIKDKESLESTIAQLKEAAAAESEVSVKC